MPGRAGAVGSRLPAAAAPEARWVGAGRRRSLPALRRAGAGLPLT